MRSEHKKHIKQMDGREQRTVARLVERSLKLLTPTNLKVSGHARTQMLKRLGRVDTEILYDVIKNSHVVEYKQVWENGQMVDKRVVLRSNKEYDDEYNYCLVYSLNKRMVVTYWKNKVWYTHENVDLKQYHAGMMVY